MFPFGHMGQSVGNEYEVFKPRQQASQLNAQAIQEFMAAMGQQAPQPKPLMSPNEGIGLGLAAILAKLLGAPDQEIGAFGQGFMGSRGQQRQQEYQGQMNDYERTREMAKMRYQATGEDAERLRDEAQYKREFNDKRSLAREDDDRQLRLEGEKQKGLANRQTNSLRMSFFRARFADLTPRQRQAWIAENGLTNDPDVLAAYSEATLGDKKKEAEIANQQARTGQSQAQTKKIHTETEWMPRLNDSRLKNDVSMREDRTVRQGQGERRIAQGDARVAQGAQRVAQGAQRVEIDKTKASTAFDQKSYESQAKAIDKRIANVEAQIRAQRARLKEKNISIELKRRLEADIQRLEVSRQGLINSYPEVKNANPWKSGAITPEPKKK